VQRERQRAARAINLQRRHEIFVADRLEAANRVWMKTAEAWGRGTRSADLAGPVQVASPSPVVI